MWWVTEAIGLAPVLHARQHAVGRRWHAHLVPEMVNVISEQSVLAKVFCQYRDQVAVFGRKTKETLLLSIIINPPTPLLIPEY